MEFNAFLQPVFFQLTAALQQLTDVQYAQKSNWLNNNTIGGHTRHIIELFQCIINGYRDGTVNYENRKRDILIEADRQLACSLLQEISQVSNLPNKKLQLLFSIAGEDLNIIEICFY